MKRTGSASLSPDIDIRYRELSPSQAAEELILNFWRMRVDRLPHPEYPHHVVPDGCVSFVCPLVATGVQDGGHTANPGGVIVVGPRMDPLVVPLREGVHYAGLRLRPEVPSLILPGQIEELAGYVGPLDSIDRSLNDSLSIALRQPEEGSVFSRSVEKAILAARSVNASVDTLVRSTVNALVSSGGTSSVRELAAAHSLSERQLQRRFKRAVGLTPKQFARIRRFRQSLTEAFDQRSPGWAGIAAVYGFSDQSHLSRECTSFTGDPPAVALERIRRIAHYNVKP